METVNIAVAEIPFIVSVNTVNKVVQLGGPLGMIFNYVERYSHYRFNYTVFQYFSSSTAKRIKMIMNKRYHMVLWPQPINEQALGKFKFSQPYFFYDIGLLTGPPKQNLVTVYDGLFVWGTELYSLILMTCLVIAILFTFSDWLYRAKSLVHVGNLVSMESAMPNHFTKTFNYVWALMAAFFAEPLGRYPKQYGSRFLLGAWLLTVFFVMTMFGAVSKSSFSVTHYDTINSIRDLLDHPEILPVALKGEGEEESLRASLDPNKLELWQRIKSNPASLLTRSQLFDPNLMLRLCKGEIGMVTNMARMALLIKLFNDRGVKLSNIYTGKQAITMYQNALMISNTMKAEMLDRINTGLLDAVGTHFWRLDFIKRGFLLDSIAWRPPAEGTDQLSLTDTRGAFYIWLWGLAFSACLFGAEILTACFGTAISVVERKSHTRKSLQEQQLRKKF